MIRELFQVQEDGQKAFPYRVELTDAGGPLYSGGAPASYNDYNGMAPQGRVQTPLAQREARLHMQTYGGGEAIDWLFKSVNFMATSASSAAYSFRDDAGNKLVAKRQPTDPPEVKNAPLLAVKLFNDPNPFMSWSDLLEILVIDWAIVGNAYCVKWPRGASQPLALYRMAPDYVRVIPGPFGPEGYLYKLPGQREEIQFQPEEVIQFKRPNPHNPYYGMGIVQGNARALDMEIALTNTAASYYENRALPSGVVSTDRRVPRDVFQKLKGQLRNFYSGSSRAGMLMVLEAGLKYDSVSPNAAEALLTQMGTWSRDRVLSMFNLNKGLLGLQDDPGDPKLADWQLLFDRKTMAPLTKKFAEGFTRALTQPVWNLDFSIDYEETLPPDQQLARVQGLAPIPGVKVKELRQAAGLNPSTGDKEIDETVLNLPGPNMDANGQNGAADANLAGEAGRPPLAANTASFGSTAQQPPQRKSAGKTRGRAVTTSNATKALDDTMRAIEARIEELEGKAEPVPPGLEYISTETAQALAGATHTLERALLDAVEGRSGTIYQRVKGAPAWTQFRKDVVSALETAATIAASHANVKRANEGKPTVEDYGSMSKDMAQDRADAIAALKSGVLADVLAKQRSGASPADYDTAIRKGIQDWLNGAAQDTVADLINDALGVEPASEKEVA